MSPAFRRRAICAVHSVGMSPGSRRPASAGGMSRRSGWNQPVRASHRLPPHETGRPVVRLRCNPPPSPGPMPRSSRAPSVHPGVFPRPETGDTPPAACASRIPRFTPADRPKSSAFTTRRRASAVAPPPGVPADLYEVLEHFDRVRREADGARLVVVPIVDRRLRDRQAVLLRDVEQLDVEAEAGDGEAREDQLGRARREALQAGLRIDRKSTRLNSSHGYISYAVFCLKKKKKNIHCTQNITCRMPLY